MEVIANITLVFGKPEAAKDVPPGVVVNLPDEEAKALIEKGFVKPASQDSNDDRFDTLVDAIEGLSPDDYGQDGKPRVRALEDFTGFSITATERDNAWKAYKNLTEE